MICFSCVPAGFKTCRRPFLRVYLRLTPCLQPAYLRIDRNFHFYLAIPLNIVAHFCCYADMLMPIVPNVRLIDPDDLELSYAEDDNKQFLDSLEHLEDIDVLLARSKDEEKQMAVSDGNGARGFLWMVVNVLASIAIVRLVKLQLNGIHFSRIFCRYSLTNLSSRLQPSRMRNSALLPSTSQWPVFPSAPSPAHGSPFSKLNAPHYSKCYP